MFSEFIADVSESLAVSILKTKSLPLFCIEGNQVITWPWRWRRSGDRIPLGAKFSAPVQPGHEDHPASCTIRTGSFPGVNSSRGVTLNIHSLLVPLSRKSRAIPLLPLWAVGPVQSLSACTRVHFTFTSFTNTIKIPHWATCSSYVKSYLGRTQQF